MSRRILVTAALPYANGSIHLGHLLEYIQSDIWARFQRLRGRECFYVCADDAHGTPIMLRARAEGSTPEALIERMQAEHQRDFTAFHIGFDHYHSTHSPENRELAEYIYSQLQAGGHIARRSITQAYDARAGMFLPDRFIRGTCPRCGAPQQYGDTCEICGATYSPAELKDAISVVSGAPPEKRNSEHDFFKLGDFTAWLHQWTRGRDPGAIQPHVDPAVANKLEEWFTAGLKDWDISRDAPYFGFAIPGAPGKYFYVWLDAPIGYMASFRHFCKLHPEIDFDAFWQADRATAEQTELYHFIGKDITYFHTLFWPAMLHGAGLRTPTAVFVHGFVTVNGRKMSKSRGTFINAHTWIEHLDPEYLRYYYAAKLGAGIEDIDLNFDDFIQRINADLVGKYVNIASRTARLLNRHCGGRLADPSRASMAVPQDPARRSALAAIVSAMAELIAQAYESRQYSLAVRQIMKLADLVNRFIDQYKPWELAQAARYDALQEACSAALDAFRVLTIYLKPILPALTAKAERFLHLEPLSWADLATPLAPGHRIRPYEHLMTRVNPASVKAILAASEESLQSQSMKKESPMNPIAPEITIDDFSRIDLRVARVVRAEQVEGADKLLRLEVDLGDQTRQVFAGIKAAYEPGELAGKLVVVVANLAPRKMRFGISAGMVLAAGPGGQEVFLVSPDSGATPGMKVK